MNKAKKINIIREIASKMKVTEIEKEEQTEEKIEENKVEESLEDLTLDAPSAREFPEFTRRTQEQLAQTPEPEIQTPSRTTEEESKSAPRYQVQAEITEQELEKKYQTSNVADRGPILLGMSEQENLVRENRFANRELQSFGSKGEEKKYESSLLEEKPVKKRKYPWE